MSSRNELEQYLNEGTPTILPNDTWFTRTSSISDITAFVPRCEKHLQLVPPVPTDTPRKLYVLLHHGNTLRMDGTVICLFKYVYQVVFCSLLQSNESLRSPARDLRWVEITDLLNQTDEGCEWDEQLRGFLVLPDLPQRHRACPESVWLLRLLLCGCRCFSKMHNSVDHKSKWQQTGIEQLPKLRVPCHLG